MGGASPLFVRPTVGTRVAVVLARQKSSLSGIDFLPSLYFHSLDPARTVAVPVDGSHLVTCGQILCSPAMIEVVGALSDLIERRPISINLVIGEPVIVGGRL